MKELFCDFLRALGAWALFFVWVSACFWLSGCSAQTPEEQEYNEQIVREMHHTCQLWVIANGGVWIAKGRTAMDAKRGYVKDVNQLRYELVQNRCRPMLRAVGY